MKLIIKALLLSFALGTSACTSFDRAYVIWKPANLKPEGTVLGLPPRTIPQSPFDGYYSGRWTSNKHRSLKGEPAGGNLRIALTKYDQYQYRANIRANWLIFKSDYEKFLYGRAHGSTLHLHGEENGFHYDGQVTPHRFTMSYQSRDDNGTIEMTR